MVGAIFKPESGDDQAMSNPFAEYDLWAGLFGGLALFLFGRGIMTQALKPAAGD